MKNYLDAESIAVHEKMRSFFAPVDDLVMIEFVENIKTAGGVFLAKEEKSIMHPIVAVGPQSEYKAGEFVMFKNFNLDVFECFGRKWSIVDKFKIASKVIPTYILEEQKYKEEVEKVKLAKLEEVKKSTIVN